MVKTRIELGEGEKRKLDRRLRAAPCQYGRGIKSSLLDATVKKVPGTVTRQLARLGC